VSVTLLLDDDSIMSYATRCRDYTHTHTCDNEPWLRLGSVYDYVKISLKIWLVSPKDWEEGKKMVWSVFVAITCQWID